jgi:hypothetical protein
VHVTHFLTVVLSLELWCGAFSVDAACAQQTEPAVQALYDPDPQHLWNRLHHALFVRLDGRGEMVGFDELDPLLWHDTTHLLEGPSHDLALRALDEFVDHEGHNLIRDPLKRAVIQHDLWFVFDWLANTVDPRRRDDPKPRALRMQVARAMRKLALPRDEIEQLPDTWHEAVESQTLPTAFDPDRPDQPFLPRDLFDEQGPWVCLTRSGPDRVTARLHARQLGARSVFLVFMRFPSPSRDATLTYLQTINLFKRPIVLVKSPIGSLVSGSRRTPVRNDPIVVNPDVPQFPAGTQVALVRRMMVIGDEGQLVPTGIVEMVQTRVYLTVNDGATVTWKESPMQAFQEIRSRRSQLLAKRAGGLSGVTLSEPKYGHFFAYGEKRQFEEGPRPLRCMGCHRGNGIHSVNTYAFGHGLAENLAPKLSPTHWSAEADRTIKSKQQRYEWGLLRGLWDSELRSP